ncbi:GNAT family N-acetyltransferase [Polaribacter haliotis]|uniref:GNAT family N-acetyltransferase n=1 Tax=Polaribacter haliotis TaxID=1888915 RepID=A0A7L8AHQ1_9FLAO|nr:GNAT family N-acetyltransferase [Polaribacter haliotis]QOD61532.1 GNAT family N-acetyltransferase [Polaribacter haliotis]
MDNKKIEIITYQPIFAKDFYELNVAWLEKYFYVEPYDEKVLSKPKENIINSGGFIFFAKYNGKIAGTVALKNQNTFFELTKMAVSPEFQGLGIGKKLLEFCIDFAIKKNWTSITLYSHRSLKSAIHIYKIYGFKEIPLEKDVHYERADIKMIMEL